MTRSCCPECGAVLKWHNLIPIISFLIQRGKCQYCAKKISWQYPMVELSTGLIFLQIFNFKFLIFNEFSISQFINLIYYLLIVSFLIIIFVYDLKHYIIPDKIVYPAIIVSLISIFLNYELLNPLFSASGAGLFFFLVILLTKGKGMGMGDVKLAFLMGLILGWPNILIALLLSFFSGAIVGVSLILFRKKKMKSQIPFGPFLSGATILVIIFGSNLFHLFEKLFYF